MPYLHFDLPRDYAEHVKRGLATDLARIYAKVMQTRPAAVSVGFRELGPGNVLRCDTTPPTDAVVVQCEVRQGRPPAQRARFAQALIARAAQWLDWPCDRFLVEFTEHAADEIYRDGSPPEAWSPGEASSAPPQDPASP